MDKSGISYVFHPWHVAESMTDEKCTIVALLHDIIEDTDVTKEDLENMGFNEDVIDAIVTMTHLKGEEYLTYIERISHNPMAIEVKIADLKHNMDCSRLENNSMPKKYELYEKITGIFREIKRC